MCDRANQIYADISKHQEYGDNIKLEAQQYQEDCQPKIGKTPRRIAVSP